ncbi:MAG: hypothetical protein M3162_01160 [Thermoproteota archaeon]|nr:hypothetical protein [Thermoproteota archaeon]
MINASAIMEVFNDGISLYSNRERKQVKRFLEYELDEVDEKILRKFTNHCP